MFWTLVGALLFVFVGIPLILLALLGSVKAIVERCANISLALRGYKVDPLMVEFNMCSAQRFHNLTDEQHRRVCRAIAKPDGVNVPYSTMAYRLGMISVEQHDRGMIADRRPDLCLEYKVVPPEPSEANRQTRIAAGKARRDRISARKDWETRGDYNAADPDRKFF